MTAGDCSTSLPVQNDVVFESFLPYSIAATELNSYGYLLTLCYSCDIKPNGNLPMITFLRDSIKISAIPLDCD